MIDEFFFDNQAQTLVEIWSEIENLLIQEICRRINKAAYLTETARFEAYKLEQANLLNERAVQIISQNTGLSQKRIRDIITNAGLSIVTQDEEIYRRAIAEGQLTVDPLPLDMSPTVQTALQSCIDNAEFGLSNLTNTRMMDAGNGWKR